MVFRANDDFNQNIYNAFIQTEFSPSTSAQMELRAIDENSGDLNLLFDPDNFLANTRNDLNTTSARLGFRHTFNPKSTLIGSYTHGSLDSNFDSDDFGLQIKEDEDVHFVEVRHLFQRNWLYTTAGVGYVAGNLNTTVDAGSEPEVSIKDSVSNTNGYVYNILRLPHDIWTTVGISIDAFDDGANEKEQVNPKFGVIWNVTPSTSVRTAAFRTLARPLVSSQTIEPTQVSGFNQLFDDIGGTSPGATESLSITHSAPTFCLEVRFPSEISMCQS